MSTVGPGSAEPALPAVAAAAVPTLVIGLGRFGSSILGRLGRLLGRAGTDARAAPPLAPDTVVASSGPSQRPARDATAEGSAADDGDGSAAGPSTPSREDEPPATHAGPTEDGGTDQGSSPTTRRLGRTVLLGIDPAEPLDPQLGAAVRAAEGLLGLGELLRAGSGAPEDGRPCLDVLLVADVAEDEAGRRLPDLVRQLGARLLQRFSNIFPGHDAPNLTICPVVALLGIRSADAQGIDDAAPDGDGAVASPPPGRQVVQALAALEDAAEGVRFRAGQQSPVARVFVVEQQTSRYELTAGEVASTVVSFLALLLTTALRLEEPLRSFLRSPVDQARDKRIFASFACATLELDLQAYATSRASAELVDGIRAATSAAAGAESVAADRLVPESEEIERRLGAPRSGDDLVTLLRAQEPTIPFPEIGWNDTPEHVREVAYGWGWFDALEAAVASQVRELDEHVMDEVTRVADERGLAAVRQLERDVRAAIRQAERSGPHGWAEALRLADQVSARTNRQLQSLGAELREQKLPAFPKPTAVESAFRQLREESTLRPRPTRLMVFGVVAALLCAALLHHLPKWAAIALVARRVPLLTLAPTSMDVDVGLARFLLDPPWAVAWLFVLLLVLATWALGRYRRKRHEALLGARDDLQAAVRRYIADDVAPSVRRYYESRLRLSLRAWALRALRSARTAAEAEVERLNAVSAGLDRLSRKLHAEADEHSGVAQPDPGDLVYRRQLSADLVAQSYDAVRPAGDLAAKLFERLPAPEHDDEPPGFLVESHIRAFVAPHVRHSDRELGRIAGPHVERFVRQMHGTLAVPLEVRGFDPRMVAQSYLFAPRWARERLDGLRADVPTLPAVLEHHDADRVHVVTLQVALSRGSIVVPEPTQEPPATAAVRSSGPSGGRA